MHINWSKIKTVSLGACLGPMQEIGMNFKHHGTVDCRQNIEMPGFLNSSKSKTRLKFMKVGMLSWSGINMSWLIFFPFGPGLGICFSGTRASHNKHDGFGRERPTFGDEMISIASYCFQFLVST